eukprot:SAG31_NODE_22332_length_528_cov_0.529138_1_plen_35_part_01
MILNCSTAVLNLVGMRADRSDEQDLYGGLYDVYV